MCCEQTRSETLRGWLRDPMIRLVMQSDGVTEQEMIALVRRVAHATATRVQPLPPRAASKLMSETYCAW